MICLRGREKEPYQMGHWYLGHPVKIKYFVDLSLKTNLR